MVREKYFSVFQPVARAFIREATGATDDAREMRLLESPRGLEKLCFGWSAIDACLGEKTIEFRFQPMSQELSGFLNGPVTTVLQENFQESQFWLIRRERRAGKWTGRYEHASYQEALQNVGQHLLIFDGGHAWIYLSDDGSTVGLARDVARRLKG